jgi:hypothetical protein
MRTGASVTSAVIPDLVGHFTRERKPTFALEMSLVKGATDRSP